MTRIIAGSARGRRLRVPPGDTTRPTSDRVREALFSTVGSILGTLEGCAVLDLYAGSGAVGLEALSRGAASCLFVERDRRALQALRWNLAQTGLAGGTVRAAEVGTVLATDRPVAADLVLLDPPYSSTTAQVTDVVAALLARPWLAPTALVVVERAARALEPPWPAGLLVDRDRRYGETRLWYLRKDDRQPATRR